METEWLALFRINFSFGTILCKICFLARMIFIFPVAGDNLWLLLPLLNFHVLVIETLRGFLFAVLKASLNCYVKLSASLLHPFMFRNNYSRKCMKPFQQVFMSCYNHLPCNLPCNTNTNLRITLTYHFFKLVDDDELQHLWMAVMISIRHGVFLRTKFPYSTTG